MESKDISNVEKAIEKGLATGDISREAVYEWNLDKKMGTGTIRTQTGQQIFDTMVPQRNWELPEVTEPLTIAEEFQSHPHAGILTLEKFMMSDLAKDDDSIEERMKGSRVQQARHIVRKKTQDFLKSEIDVVWGIMKPFRKGENFYIPEQARYKFDKAWDSAIFTLSFDKIPIDNNIAKLCEIENPDHLFAVVKSMVSATIAGFSAEWYQQRQHTPAVKDADAAFSGVKMDSHDAMAHGFGSATNFGMETLHFAVMSHVEKHGPVTDEFFDRIVKHNKKLQVYIAKSFGLQAFASLEIHTSSSYDPETLQVLDRLLDTDRMSQIKNPETNQVGSARKFIRERCKVNYVNDGGVEVPVFDVNVDQYPPEELSIMRYRQSQRGCPAVHIIPEYIELISKIYKICVLPHVNSTRVRGQQSPVDAAIQQAIDEGILTEKDRDGWAALMYGERGIGHLKNSRGKEIFASLLPSHDPDENEIPKERLALDPTLLHEERPGIATLHRYAHKELLSENEPPLTRMRSTVGEQLTHIIRSNTQEWLKGEIGEVWKNMKPLHSGENLYIFPSENYPIIPTGSDELLLEMPLSKFPLGQNFLKACKTEDPDEAAILLKELFAASLQSFLLDWYAKARTTQEYKDAAMAFSGLGMTPMGAIGAGLAAGSDMNFTTLHGVVMDTALKQGAPDDAFFDLIAKHNARLQKQLAGTFTLRSFAALQYFTTENFNEDTLKFLSKHFSAKKMEMVKEALNDTDRSQGYRFIKPDTVAFRSIQDGECSIPAWDVDPSSFPEEALWALQSRVSHQTCPALSIIPDFVAMLNKAYKISVLPLVRKKYPTI